MRTKNSKKQKIEQAESKERTRAKRIKAGSGYRSVERQVRFVAAQGNPLLVAGAHRVGIGKSVGLNLKRV